MNKTKKWKMRSKANHVGQKKDQSLSHSLWLCITLVWEVFHPSDGYTQRKRLPCVDQTTVENFCL